MWKVLFVCFLLVAAGQDLMRKQVDAWVFLAFGAAAAALAGGRWLLRGEAYGIPEHMAGISLGFALLAAGRISGGSIGFGDGCFFLVSGGMLGFWENMALLCYSTLCCGVFCLGYFVWCKLRDGKNIGKLTVPFLPFAVLPGMWLAVRELGRFFVLSVKC